jgi:hypothetical protein
VVFFLFFFLLQTIIPTAFRSQVGNPYLTGLWKGVTRAPFRKVDLIKTNSPGQLMGGPVPYCGNPIFFSSAA